MYVNESFIIDMKSGATIKTLRDISTSIHNAINNNLVSLPKILCALNIDSTIRKRYEFSKDSMLKVLILKKLKQMRFNTKVIEYLSAHQDEALELGFYKAANNLVRVPDRRTLGLFEDGLTAEDTALIEFATKTMEDVLYTKGVLPDVSVSNQKLRTKEPSKSTIYRSITERTKDLSRIVKKTLLKQIKTHTNYNSIYNDEAFLDLLIHISLSQDFAKDGSKVLRTLKDDKVPLGATLFYYLKKYNVDEISEVFKRIFDITFKMSEKANLVSRRTRHTIAIDCHEWFYYGKNIEGGVIVGKKPERGTMKCFKFITLDIVDRESRFTLLALPVLKTVEEGTAQIKLVKQLIEDALTKIKVW